MNQYHITINKRLRRINWVLFVAVLILGFALLFQSAQLKVSRFEVDKCTEFAQKLVDQEDCDDCEINTNFTGPVVATYRKGN